MGDTGTVGPQGTETKPSSFSLLPSSFEYSASLNCVLACVNGTGLEVLDVHSRSVVARTNIPDGDSDATLLKFIDREDKIFVSSGNRVGCRSTQNEQLFLNTILQVAEVPRHGTVTLELDIVKAGLLLSSLETCMSTTSSTLANQNPASQKNMTNVLMTLRTVYDKTVLKMEKMSAQGIKWLSVLLSMEHSVLTSVFNDALVLTKAGRRGPALPVLGDVLQRLAAMQRSVTETVSSEKRLMFNEVDRLDTFNCWPHMDYRWALPGPMAEAGFYHPSSSAAEDRAMCFTCSVCLVCWESSDQPWSEHKRHSSNCSFVKGDHTENVTLPVYAATAGAQKLSRQNNKVTCISSSSCDGLMAVGTDDGFIIIWEIYPALRLHSEYQLSMSSDMSSTRKKGRTSSEKQSKKKKDLKTKDVKAAQQSKGPSTLKSMAEDAAAGLLDPIVESTIDTPQSTTTIVTGCGNELVVKRNAADIPQPHIVSPIVIMEDLSSTPSSLESTPMKTRNDVARPETLDESAIGHTDGLSLSDTGLGEELTELSLVSVGSDTTRDIVYEGETYCVIDEFDEEDGEVGVVIETEQVGVVVENRTSVSEEVVDIPQGTDEPSVAVDSYVQQTVVQLENEVLIVDEYVTVTETVEYQRVDESEFETVTDEVIKSNINAGATIEPVDKNTADDGGKDVEADAGSPMKKVKMKQAVERDCHITSVALMSDNASSKFIIAGVSIETRKPASRDGTRAASNKRKLSLLLYKLVKKSVTTSVSKPKKMNASGNVGGLEPGEEDLLLDDADMDLYNEDYLLGGGGVGGGEDSDGDYCMFDEQSAGVMDMNESEASQYDTSELSVIDEYLLAAEKKMSAGGGGGTQNLAAGINQAKAGYEEIEVVKMDESVTYTEDCTFHKADLPREFYNSDTNITDMLVMGQYLVVVLKNGTDDEMSHVLVYSIRETGEDGKQTIAVELCSSKTYLAGIRDVEVIECSKMQSSFLLNFCLDEIKDSDDPPSSLNVSLLSATSLLVLGLSTDTISFLLVPGMHEFQLNLSLPEGRHLHKFAYCSGLSSIAICDDLGSVSFHSCSPDLKSKELSTADSVTTADSSWQFPLPPSHIELLTELTRREPVVTGCYIFFPVNWCMLGRGGGGASGGAGSGCGSGGSRGATAQMPPHMLRMVPVEMDKRLLKRTEMLDTQGSRLDFVFRMFLLVQTSVSHFELVVNFKTALAPGRDILCTIYLDAEKTDSCQPQSVSQQTLDPSNILVGPVPFSSTLNEARTSAQFTLVSPALMRKRSAYIIIKFEHGRGDGPLGTAWPESARVAPGDFVIPDLLQDVNVGVYQFKSLPPSDFFFSGCRNVLLSNQRLQEQLVDQLLTLVSSSADRGESISHLLHVLSWIVASHVHALQRKQLPLIEILQSRMTQFLSACLVYGDRNMCHRCSQVLLGVLRCCDRSSTFVVDLYSALWDLVPHTLKALSSAATHWMFVMFTTIIQQYRSVLNTVYTDSEIMGRICLFLVEVGDAYAKNIKKTQKTLDARYGLTDNVFEPLMETPLELKLRCGAYSRNSSTSLSQPSDMLTQYGQKRNGKVVSVPADYLPGIFEAQPLHFSCLNTSDGSRVESMNAKESAGSKPAKSSTGTQAAAAQAQPSMEIQTQVAAEAFLYPPNVVAPSALGGAPYIPDTLMPLMGYAGEKDMEETEVDSQMTWDKMTATVNKTEKMKSSMGNGDELNADGSQATYTSRNPLCLLVDKMHLYSWHYAVVHFASPVYLTDLVLPPCPALASVTISAWLDDPNQEITLVYSDEISHKAVVVSNLMPAIECSFVKILVVGGDSCSAVVPLGDYYGQVKRSEHSQELFLSQQSQRLEDAFCHYTLAADRIKPLPGKLDLKLTKGVDSVFSMTRKDYIKCSELQLELNFLRKNKLFADTEYLVCDKSLLDTARSESSGSSCDLENTPFSSQQQLLSGLLKLIVSSFTATPATVGGANVSPNVLDSVTESPITKDNCFLLFKNICTYGAKSITRMGMQALFQMCGSMPWWTEVLVDIFKFCFGESSLVPLPQARLFDILIQLIVLTEDTSAVAHKFLALLEAHLNWLMQSDRADEGLVDGETDVSLLDMNSLDWLLLILVHLLNNDKNVVRCSSGHPVTRSSRDTNWVCDAMNDPRGCRRGLGRMESGTVRYRCQPCDYDLCDRCYEEKRASVQPYLNMWNFFRPCSTSEAVSAVAQSLSLPTPFPTVTSMQPNAFEDAWKNGPEHMKKLFSKGYDEMTSMEKLVKAGQYPPAFMKALHDKAQAHMKPHQSTFEPLQSFGLPESAIDQPISSTDPFDITKPAKDQSTVKKKVNYNLPDADTKSSALPVVDIKVLVSESQSNVTEADHWDCVTCTFRNLTTSTACEMCGIQNTIVVKDEKAEPKDATPSHPGIQFEQNVVVGQDAAIPVLKSLLLFVTRKIEYGNTEQIIMACKLCSLILMNCESHIPIESVLDEVIVNKILKASTQTHSNKWIVHTLKLLLIDFAVQKPTLVETLTRATPDNADDNERGTTAQSPAHRESAMSMDLDTMNPQQMLSQSQLIKMHESMNKKFYEATENFSDLASKYKVVGGKASSSADKVASDTAPSESDTPMLPSACDVAFIIPNSFNRLLDQTCLRRTHSASAERSLCAMNSSSQQTVSIDDPSSYLASLRTSSCKTVLYLIGRFCALARSVFTPSSRRDFEQAARHSYLEQLLVFLDLLEECGGSLDGDERVEAVKEIVTSCLRWQHSEPMFENVLKSLMNHVGRVSSTTDLLLTMDESTDNVQSRAQDLPASRVAIYRTSIRDTLHKPVLLEHDRIQSKKLLVRLLQGTSGASYQLADADALWFEDAGMWNKVNVFRLATTIEETSLNAAVLELVCSFIYEFTKHHTAAMQEKASENFDKSTIFILSDGNVHFTGKAHRARNHELRISHLLDIVKSICYSCRPEDVECRWSVVSSGTGDNGNAEPEYRSISPSMISSCRLLVHSLTYCGSLSVAGAIARKLGGSGRPQATLMEASVELLNTNQNSIGKKIQTMICECAAELPEVWAPIIVKILIEILRTSTAESTEKSDSSGSNEIGTLSNSRMLSIDGMKILMKSLFTCAPNTAQLFLAEGGLFLICDRLIEQDLGDLCYMDLLGYSPVICDVLNLPSTQAHNKKFNAKDRVRKDEDGVILENYAPFAKITAPPPAGADVLLVDKSPLRRSRFAAWAHQFTETDDPWISLVITFPHEVLLREAVVHMHSSYLGGAPSQVIVEGQGVGNEFSRLSPPLQTGGLVSIIIRFASGGVIVNKLRFWMRRPNGSDHLKLNLIELFARSVFAGNEPTTLSALHHATQIPIDGWIDLFTQALLDAPHAIDKLHEYAQLDTLFSSLVRAMPFIQRVTLHRLASILTMVFLKDVPDFALTLTRKITTILLSPRSLTRLRSSQVQLLIQLIADLIARTDDNKHKFSVFDYALDWFHSFLRSTLDHSSLVVCDVIKFFTQKIFSLIGDTTMDHAAYRWNVSKESVEERVHTVKDVMMQSSVHESTFAQLGKYLNWLVSIDQASDLTFLNQLVEEGTAIIDKRYGALPFQMDLSERVTLKKLLMRPALCFNQSNRSILMADDGFLPSLARHIESCVANLSAHRSSALWEMDMCSLIHAIDVFLAMFYGMNDVGDWFSHTSSRCFWSPLLSYLYMETGCGGARQRWQLRSLYSLQRRVTLLFSKLLYLSPENQEVFCDLLIDLLKEVERRKATMSGFLKCLLVQLVVTEGTVSVHFKSKSDHVYILQNTHVLHLRKSATLTEIEHNLLKVKGTAVMRSSSRPTSGTTPAASTLANSSQSPVPGQASPGDSTGQGDNEVMDLQTFLMQSGKLAAAKRQPKQKSATSSEMRVRKKSYATGQLSIDFHLATLGNEPLPKHIQVSQILRKLHDSDTSALRKPPVLEYCISLGELKSQQQSEDSEAFGQSSTTTTAAVEAWDDVSPLKTILEMFADKNGLSLLATLTQESSETAGIGHVSLLRKVMSLPGYAQVFLKDRWKAEMLLRLMLGVPESATGQHIRSLPAAHDLPVVPLLMFRELIRATPNGDAAGRRLRDVAFERGIIDTVLEELSSLTHQKKEQERLAAGGSVPASNYWAKGTGFGTGSTLSNWDVEKALKCKKKEEDQIVVIFQVLASFIGSLLNGADPSKLAVRLDLHLPDGFVTLITASCLISVISGYLHNDSVLDMSRRIPLYHSIMELLHSLVSFDELLTLLIQPTMHCGSSSQPVTSIVDVFGKLKSCVDLYQNTLRASGKNKKKESKLVKPNSKSLANKTTETRTDDLKYIELSNTLDVSNKSTMDNGNVVKDSTQLQKTSSECDADVDAAVGVVLPEAYKSAKLKLSDMLKKKMEEAYGECAITMDLDDPDDEKENTVGPLSKKPPSKRKAKTRDSEELSLLLEDISMTYEFVMMQVAALQRRMCSSADESNESCPSLEDASVVNETPPATETDADVYLRVIKPLQFDSYEIITEKDDGTLQFNVPFHYANQVKMSQAASGDTPARYRRLAQEVQSLATSLPVSYSSSVFLRCDEERIDVMKVLITGPEDTPYANGCFEFDVYFPLDYPTSPMSVNLCTTGKHTIRFNPNLYNDGKVCLSILNTWHGRPEERWNANTSNLLQVLVSIQSLILVCEPYFNEPGYERLRNTPQGKQNNDDYNANIRQATAKWAILEQLRRPSACFKEVVQSHFRLKKHVILRQCEGWMKELKEFASKRKICKQSYESLKLSVAEMRAELDKLCASDADLASPSSAVDSGNEYLDTDASPEHGGGVDSTDGTPDNDDDFDASAVLPGLDMLAASGAADMDATGKGGVVIGADGDSYSVTDVVYL